MPRPGSDQPEHSPDPSYPATLKFATALVQDGISGVTVVLPRSPHVLAEARETAAAAGVEVQVEQIGWASITLRFVAQSTSRREAGNDERTTRRARGWPGTLLPARPWAWAARIVGVLSPTRRRRR